MKAYKMVGNTKSGMREEILREYKRMKCVFQNGIEEYPGGYENIAQQARDAETEARKLPDNPVEDLERRRNQRNPQGKGKSDLS